MGNHDAGKAMVIAAVGMRKLLPDTISRKQALQILDEACKPWRDCDAEFDDAPFEPGVFRQLLEEAFAPDNMGELQSDVGDAEEVWYDLVYQAFRERYDLW